jgi:HK97 family phage prohead protease
MSKLDEFPVLTRSVPLLDLERSGSDGRTVTAYAATFDDPYPVSDFDGQYDEIINRTAFNRHLGQHGFASVKVLVNHGMTMFQTPSERFGLPVATPVDVRPDGTGLLTVSRYANTELADEVLQLIEDGAVTSMSFRGPIIRSGKPYRRDNRRTIERVELGLIEYGPVALLPANPNARIMAVRSLMLADQLGELTDEERAELLEALQAITPVEPDPVAVDPDTPDTAVEAPVADPSIDIDLLANANRRRRDPSKD